MIGETIGHFKVVSRLGRGGMGEVFGGEHESIQTRVAIKVLHTEVSQNAEHVQRFFNEARIVSRIKHAGIVKIFDVGSYREHAYLIMELLEGEPLATRIHRSARLPWQETIDIARQIASVLDATHRAGVIHRDLKPDNIFLVVDHELASGERVKVLDFGISKLSGTMASGSPKTVGTMGTPAYMAPEQWGDSGNVDWRADAYSLGCALFEMVCGRPPFVVHTIAEACAKHLHAQPPTPGALAAMPTALDALIRRLLAKDPADRASSMGQVARELAEIAAAPGTITESASAGTPLPAGLAVTVPPTLATDGDTHGIATSNERPSGRATPATTLGHSAGELRVEPPRKPRPRKLALAIGAGVLAIGGLVVAVAVRSSDGGASQPMAPASAPPAPVASAPPPVPSPQPPPPPVADQATKVEITLQPIEGLKGHFESNPPGATVSPPAKPERRRKPRETPPTPAKPKPANAGSADNGFGGRI